MSSSYATLHIAPIADANKRDAIRDLFKGLQHGESLASLSSPIATLGPLVAAGLAELAEHFPASMFRVTDYVKQNGELRITFGIPHEPNDFLPALVRLLDQAGILAHGGHGETDGDGGD